MISQVPDVRRQVRAAAVQAEPVWLDAKAGVAKTVELIAQADRGGADLIVFPEVWIPGYPVFLWLGAVAGQVPFVGRYHAQSLAVDGPELTTVREAARRHAMTVVLGFSERRSGTLLVSQVVIGEDGGVLIHRHKLKPTHVERSLFGDGDGSDLVVVPTAAGRLGAMACAEHHQPLNKQAMYAQNEEVHAASWPCYGVYRDVAYALSPDVYLAANQMYALEGSCFTVASTQLISQAGVDMFAGTDEQRRLLRAGGGFARIYAPDGRLISDVLDEQVEGLVYADLDLDLIPYSKNVFDPAGHYARPDALQLVHHREPHRAVLSTGNAPASPRADLPALKAAASPAGTGQ